MRKKYKIRIGRITNETLLNLAFILFFCSSFATTILRWCGVPSNIGIYVVLAAVYGLILAERVIMKRGLVIDFWILLICVVLFFCITYLVNPDYRYWYTRATYGFWDYVLKPDNGIYAYLFLRLMKKPERIIKNLKICSWIMYVFYARLLLNALNRGYWETIGSKGTTVHLSYSLSFGYSVLLFTLVLLYEALMKRKVIDMIGSLIGIVMIILGGSRGPILCIVVFLLMMGIVYLKKSKKKIIILSIVALAAVLSFVFSDFLVQLLLKLMSSLNISSRTITMMLEGTVSDDHGRNEIWQAAIQMIKENPLGYGAMGSRRVIAPNYHIAGHCHDIILEMMVDFGVIIACLILLFLLKQACSIILDDRYQKWRGLFIIFVAASSELFISSCFWTLNVFWGSIAIGYMAFKDAKGVKKKVHRKSRIRITQHMR